MVTVDAKMSYQSLFDAFKRCYSGEWTKQKIQEEANQVWKTLKEDKQNLASNLKAKIIELDKASVDKKAKFLNFFVQVRNIYSSQMILLKEYLCIGCQSSRRNRKQK